MTVTGAWPRFLRRLSASMTRPNVVRGTAPGSRSASTSGLAVSNSPVVSLTLYPPSVLVSWHDPDAADAPVERDALVHQAVVVHRLVRAMETAHSDVDDTRRDQAAI